MDAYRSAVVVLSAARRDSSVLTDPEAPLRLAADLVGNAVQDVAAALVEPWYEQGGRVMWPDDPAWPQGLAVLGPAAPLMLWVRGELPVAPDEAIAIVGARRSTEYGRQAAQELARCAADLSRVVVSGGALGIDGHAHRAALAAEGHTVLVAAGGAGRRYPPEHSALFDHAAPQGAVVWEFPRSVPLSKEGFLARNRLIAAMTATTIVVEAAERSGALNTGRTAADLGRLVLAVPGPVFSRMSAGCHRAIADGWAAILLGTTDLRALMAPIPV